MTDQKPVAKTDMAAGITDNKSGAPGRPPKVSRKLKKEEAVYQRDVLKKDVSIPVATEESAGGKKHELTNLLQREEARLQKIGQHLDKPELLEQNLREQTTQKSESALASTANIKTDTNMRMTDDVRGPSPDQNAEPRGQQAPSGGGGGPKLVRAGSAGGKQPQGGAPRRGPSKEKVATGKATGTSYATQGNYPKTDMGAVITDNRSKMKDMSRTALEDLKRQEESYARDRLLMAALAQGPPVAGTRGSSIPQRSDRASVQRGRSMQQQTAGTPGVGGTAGHRPSLRHGLKVITASPDLDEETTTTSEEQAPGMTCWLMPQCVQRVIDSGMEKIYGPRPRRPYRPPMLEMEVDEDDDYDPYTLKIEAVQRVHKPEEGRVMYPSKKRHKKRLPKKRDSNLVLEDELVISSGASVTLDDDAGRADERNMRVKETEDALYVKDVVYQGGLGGCMMQPMGQPRMQPMMLPMMPLTQQMGQPMICQMRLPMMGQPMMPQMGQSTMQPLVVRSMSAQDIVE
ncbi:uncharacterized protein LOC142802746 [Rhipicephalus microplus]|uniref:uncharacterized protein LOC142802746 n=1 Tax=Rhipicephalus microplus TaxID=6941 RepID=UPI003F6AEF3C